MTSMSASSPGRSAEVPTSASQYAYTENSKDLILRSFVPHVAIYASQDTEELARRKGIRAGFKELLRPFGDSIHGKVVIRDSAGASRSWDNYGVRFVALGDGTESSAASDVNAAEANDAPSDRVYNEGCPYLDPTRTGGDIGQIEDLVNGYISLAETQPDVRFSGHGNQNGSSPGPSSSMSPFYALYLQRLLSGLPVTPHETFSHPVACIIAISSRNPAPIEALRQLYSSSSQGNGRLPRWVSNEFLRYYVLVHDEDRDDITKSTALFDQMKRHFGLHCHLLRLRSSDCVPSDDDSVRLPQAAWISAAEELARLRERGE